MYRGCERSVITYSSLISACEKAGQVGASRARRRRVRAPAKPCGSLAPPVHMLAAAGLLGRPSSARQHHQPTPNPRPARHQPARAQWELALELFQEMLREQCSPNTVTFNSLITALAQGKCGAARRRARGRQPRGACACRAARLRRAPAAVPASPPVAMRSMPARLHARPPDRAPAGAQWQKASEVFEQMLQQGCNPDVVTCVGWRRACSGDAAGVAWRCRRRRRRRCWCCCTTHVACCSPLPPPAPPRPPCCSYTALISAFEKGGQWRLALEVRLLLLHPSPLGSAALCVRPRACGVGRALLPASCQP